MAVIKTEEGVGRVQGMLVGRGVSGQSLQEALETSLEGWAGTRLCRALKGRWRAQVSPPEGAVHPDGTPPAPALGNLAAWGQ